MVISLIPEARIGTQRFREGLHGGKEAGDERWIPASFV